MFPAHDLIEQMPRLRRFSLRLTHDAADADDLLQSTLLRAMEKSGQFHEGTDLYKWSSCIMFSIFASQYRRRTKFETKYDPEPLIAKQSVAPSQEEYTDLSFLRDKIAHLSPAHRDIVTMTCLEDASYDEAAEALNIPVGTVRSRLGRARAQLDSMPPVFSKTMH